MPIVTVDLEFKFGQMVYLKTDIYQYPRQVVGVFLDISDTMLYKLQQGNSSSTHYAMGITADKDSVITLTN